MRLAVTVRARTCPGPSLIARARLIARPYTIHRDVTLKVYERARHTCFGACVSRPHQPAGAGERLG